MSDLKKIAAEYDEIITIQCLKLNKITLETEVLDPIAITVKEIIELQQANEELKRANAALSIQNIGRSALESEFLSALNNLFESKIGNKPTKPRF